jgi:peptidoglycan/LPS O-acetylase OafA/YrhL
MGQLRFLLALSVVVWHTKPIFGLTLLSGYSAVRIFFVISGFYMSLILTTKYGDARTFWINRALRLYPAYLAFILLTWAWYFFEWAWLHKPPTTDPRLMLAYQDMHWWERTGFIISNWSMIGQDIPSLFNYEIGTGFVFPGSRLEGNIWAGALRTIGPAWSIGIEIWFYLLAPWLVRQSNRLLALLVAISVAAELAVTSRYNFDIAYYGLPTNLWLFIVGIILQRVDLSWVPSLIFKAAPTVIVAAIVFWPIRGGVNDTITPAEAMFSYIIFVPTIPILFAATKHLKWDAYIGNLSYPIYLSHMRIIGIFQTALHSGAILIIAGTLVISLGTYHLIEVPIDRWRQSLVVARRKSMHSPTSNSARAARLV